MPTKAALLACILALLTLAPAVAGADVVTPSPAAKALFPRVFYHIERIKPGANPQELGTVDLAGASFVPRYADFDWSVDSAVHPGSGRFALALSAVGEPHDITLDGRALRVEWNKPVIIAVGTLDGGVQQIIPGDPKCVPMKCFEQPWLFSLDGTRLYTAQVHQSTTKVRSYPLANPAAATLVLDRKKVHAVNPVATPDQTRWVYEGRGGLYVENLPVFPAAKKPVLPKAAKPSVAPEGRVDAPVTLLGDTVALFRREVPDRKLGLIELHDLKTMKVHRAYTFAAEAPLWYAGFKTSASEHSVVFAAERKLIAVSVLDGSARTLATDVNQLFDISADGHFALVETTAVPKPDSGESGAKNPMSFTIIELATGKRVASQPIPLAGASFVRVEEAYFL